ncbi:hypothetical protein GHT06_001879 [Daphnia sinensis]|uniref:Uncharacterized protein n=1 Tax=Daphnia sinensis TaxID=1820382 RepID=A0AAD5PLT8_9CRUS|nr:hypothetical protein GHT06_001879 [Daphnia sinensis]
MKISDLTTILNEVSMSPSSLRAMASTVDARVGIEFEMFVPGLEDEDAPDDDGEVTSLDDVMEYYRREMRFPDDRVKQLNDALRDDYLKWTEISKENLWFTHMSTPLKRKSVLGYMRKSKSFDFKEALETVIDRLDDTDPDRKQYLKKQAQVALTAFLDTSQVSVAMNVLDDLDGEDRVIAQTVVKIVKKKIEDRMTELVNQVDFQPTKEESVKIREYASEKFANTLLSPDSWLSSITRNEPNITNVKQYIERKYPQFIPARSSTPSRTQATTREELAEILSDVVGMPVESGDYHRSRISANNYRLEEDGSLSGYYNMSGVELITPHGGLSLVQMYDHLDKVIEWAKSYGAETNRQTGLHINVSVPNMKNLDYVKLVLFLGDKYILDQFGRSMNEYCASSYKKIDNMIMVRSEQASEFSFRVAEYLQNGLTREASKEIFNHSTTSKYVSANIKNGYIEFRSPGGDWLNKDLGVLINTINRFVVALSIACDPEKYKKEYIKKLYTMLIRHYDAGMATRFTPDSVINSIAQFHATYIANRGNPSQHDISSFKNEMRRKLNASRMWRKSEPTIDPNITRGLGTGAPLSSIGKPRLNTGNGEDQ